MQILSLPMHVDAASPLAFVVVGRIFPYRKIEMTIISGGLVGMNARAANGWYEQAADRQSGVADRFGRIAVASLMGHEPIERIPFAKFGGYDRRLTIRSAGSNELHHVLNVPAAANKLVGQ